jgi:hypothetical protein
MRRLQASGKRFGVLSGALALAFAGVIVPLEREAQACGGCFTPPPPPNEVESVITDEKMILSVSTTQTTLYDQINYSGAPSSFAWVLPIKGTVQVGLSADILFQTIEQLTATQVTQPPTNCPPPPTCQTYANTGSAAPGIGSGSGDGTVTVTSQAQVGPYETVQLHSTDGSALNQWLTAHGYQIPASTKTVVDAYVTQGFDFLALKLVPGQGVQAMQPVRVTSKGAAPTLPLHMVAVGTGPVTGITIWVVADARWEPANFPTFQITDPEIAWDWATSSSNYESLRLAKEAALGGRGWQIESSLELNQNTISQSVLQNVQYDQNGSVGGYLSPVTPPDAGASTDAGDGGLPDAAPTAVPEAGSVESQLAAANADLAVFFAGVALPNARLTRMRSDVAQSALSVDMALQAATDQSEISNIHTPQTEIGEPLCPVYNNTCSQVGVAPRGQAQASASASAISGGGAGCSTTRPRTGTAPTFGFFAAFALLGGARVAWKRRAARRDR